MTFVARRGVAWLGPLLLSSLLLASVARAAPDPREMQAREAFAAGRYQDALDVFVKLYAEKLHPNYLRNIGRCYQNLGEPDRAISSFREYLRKSKKSTTAEREEIEGYIAEMEQLKKTQANRQTAEGKPSMASAPPAAAPAPAASATERGAGPTQVVIVERDLAAKAEPAPAVDLSARPMPAPAPAVEESSPVYKRWWFWAIVGGVVAAGVGGAAAAGLFTKKVDGACDPGSMCK